MKNFKIKVFFRNDKNDIIDIDKISIENIYDNILDLYIKYIENKN